MINNSLKSSKKDILNDEALLKKLNAPLNKLPNHKNLTLTLIKNEIFELIKSYSNLKNSSIEHIKLSLSPNHTTEDITLDAFHLAKIYKINPIKLCTEFSKAASFERTKFCKSVTAIKGYLNFCLNQNTLINTLSAEVLSEKENYGKANIHENKVIIIDYSGPNIAKPIGVGHLRSTIIGQALANIYEATGYKVLKINHIGDWGTQFGALIHAYETYNDEKSFKENPIGTLKSLYVKFHEEKKSNPELEDIARAHFKKLEEKSPYQVNLWQSFRQLSIESFEKIYSQFDVSFDAYLGESFFSDKLSKAIHLVKEKKLCHSQNNSNALIVENLDNLPTFLLQKEDGASLYMTRDLAALLYRAETFNPDSILYVVGNEQSLHFKQLFSLYKKLEKYNINQLTHIGFGLILTDGKKMSTRAGTLIELDSLIQKTKEKLEDLLKEKQTKLDTESIHKIAIGTIIYNDLSRTRTKDIDFNWKTMLSMESGSSIYLQYTYARMASILRKFNERFESLQNTSVNISNENLTNEFKIYNHLLFFSQVTENARQTNMPNIIANYLESLAQICNTYYAKTSIKDSSDSLFKLRYNMIKCINHVLKNGLKLLNIHTLDRM
jgi:arginyl-tRNA synthetase